MTIASPASLSTLARRSRPARFGFTAIAAGLLAVGGPLAALDGAAGAAAPPGDPAATGEWQVLAQGLVTLDAGAMTWHATDLTVEPAAANGAEVAPAGPSFVIGGAGGVVVDGPAASAAWLADGEAVFRPVGGPVLLAPTDDAVGAATVVELVRGEADDPAATLAVAGGRFDVELRADGMEPGESVAIASVLPVLVIARSGAIAGGSGVTVAAGDAAVIPTTDGEVTVTVTSDEQTEVLIAVITAVGAGGAATANSEPDEAGTIVAGPGTTAPAGPATSATTTTMATAPPASTMPATTTTPPPTAAPTTTPTPATTVAPSPDPDSDGDGVSDIDEVAHNSSSTDPDSDGDGLSDGREINELGTSPVTPDTDGDRLGDYHEVTYYGSNPRDPDSDGDEINDWWETQEYRTNPLAADTDGDGWNDKPELLAGTDPRDPTSHP